jgi:hypothetical protein
VDARRYNFKHTLLVYALPSSLDPSAFSSMERVYSAKSYPHLPVKVIKAEWGRLTDRCGLPSQISVVGTRGLITQPNVAAQGFLSHSLLCHAALILIRSFLVFPTPTSRFRALVLARMTDGPPRSTSSCASAPPCRPLRVAISVPVMPSSLFPSTLSIFAPTSLPHPTILCLSYAEHPSPVSDYVVSCVPSLPMSFDFSVLFLHTISLIHRHLALYHS